MEIGSAVFATEQTVTCSRNRVSYSAYRLPEFEKNYRLALSLSHSDRVFGLKTATHFQNSNGILWPYMASWVLKGYIFTNSSPLF